MEEQPSFELDAIAPQGNSMCSYDYISVLPDEILSYILSFLSMEEAFRTRLVSCRWRYLCVPVLNLKLNSKFIFNSIYKDKDYLGFDKSKMWEIKSDFVRKVDQYLKTFPGKKLVSFEIDFYLGSEFAFHIDKWISFAVRMEVERIHLYLSKSYKVDLYTFPCHLLLPFDGVGGSHLKFLCLEKCLLRPPPELVNRLNSLKSLELDTVVLDDRDMNVILSGCLNLETLGLRNCFPILTLRLDGQFVPQLRWLFVDGCPELRNIEIITCVGLERFEYKGQMTRFTFSELPPLTKVFLWFFNPFERGMDYMFNGLPRDFPHLQNLTLSWISDMARPVPARMTTFGCLKQLHLILILSTDFDLLSVTSILNACPVLEKFLLSLHLYSCRGGRPIKEYSSHQHLRLKEVIMNGFRDIWNAVELAVYLLKNAVALERMIIDRRTNKYYGGERWTYSQVLEWPEWKELTPHEIHDLLFKHKFNPKAELICL